MKWGMAGGALSVAAILVVAWWLHASPASGARTPSLEALAPAAPLAGTPGRNVSVTPAEFGEPPTASKRTQPPPAWQTMAEAREHGDDRAPPIERPLPESQAPAPTAWDLSDPARYREYELRGQQRLRAEYLMAVEEELPKWKALLARARASGAPPAAIAEAQDKIRHLEARQVALRNSE
ncbi:hypothetical protein [Lysobacter tyrosinilyticus]